MAIKRIQLENVTVFESLDLKLSPGLNIFIGENGMGKTHVMKLIYSACKAARRDVSFAQKVVRVFMPDGSNIRRLVSRSNHGDTAKTFSYDIIGHGRKYSVANSLQPLLKQDIISCKSHLISCIFSYCFHRKASSDFDKPIIYMQCFPAVACYFVM